MKKVIVKCDDFWACSSGNQFSEVFEIARKNKIKLSVGLIGCSLEPEIDYSKVKRYIKNGTIEIYNHSYRHFMEKDGGRRELLRMDHGYQKGSIEETNAIAKRVLGVEISTIGFPANACDNTTLSILAENEQIKNIYHVAGSYNSDKVASIGKRVINIDHGIFEKRSETGDVFLDYDAVIEHFDTSTDDLIVYQMHPLAWEHKCITDFERIMLALKDKQAEFIFPSDL